MLHFRLVIWTSLKVGFLYCFFVDIEECAEDLDDCDDVTEYCTNTIGGFECNCRDGYERVDGECQSK